MSTHFCTANPCPICGRSFSGPVGPFPSWTVVLGPPGFTPHPEVASIHRASVKHAQFGKYWWFHCSCGVSRWSYEWDVAMEQAHAHIAKESRR